MDEESLKGDNEEFKLQIKQVLDLDDLAAEPIAPKIPGEIQEGLWRKKKLNNKTL